MTVARVTSLLSTIAIGWAIVAISPAQQANAADLPDGTIVDEEPSLKTRKWNELVYGNQTLDFNGYFRIGSGWDADGHQMPSFQAPGSTAKYRLGNEDVQGGEIVLDYRYYLDGVPADKTKNTTSRFIQIQGRWEDFENIKNYDNLYIEFDNDHTKESFVRLGNFLGEGTHAWFGRRFYDRRDIHMIDHFWLNVAQGSDYGGGVEGIPLWGNKTIDVAAFYAYDESAEGETGDNINSYMIDARLRGYSTGPDGKLTLVGQIGIRPGYETPSGVSLAGLDTDDQIGFAIGGYHELANVMGGRNNTGFMFRQGAAMVQNDFNSRAPTESQGYDLSEAFSIEANNDLVIEPNENWSMQWATVVRYENFGSAAFGEGDSIFWASTGIRPVYYLTNHINIAFESGLDWISNDRIDASGHVWKNTIALQLQEKRGYFERPVLRAFATYADWAEDLEGKVGGTNFADDSDGFIFGVQLESWW